MFARVIDVITDQAIPILDVTETFGVENTSPLVALKEVNREIEPGESISAVWPLGYQEFIHVFTCASLLSRFSNRTEVPNKLVNAPVTDVASGGIGGMQS